MTKTIAILIPCYNEELSIAKVINDFKSELPNADIYVYDNNSTDDTAQISKEHGATVVSVLKIGKGNVVRSMFMDVNADVYVSVTGDNNNNGISVETPFKTISHALEMIFADSLNINTIHLEGGIYSPSSNSETFPIHWSDYVNFSGDPEIETILNGSRAVVTNDTSG